MDPKPSTDCSNMTASILALTRYDRVGASSRVRFLQYVPHLERMGMQVAVQPLLPREYLTRLYADGSRSPTTVAAAFINRLWKLLGRNSSDIIWLQREVLPFLPFGLEKVLLAHKRIVIDFDDAHHLYYKNSRSRIVRALCQDKTESLMRHAQAVVVGNKTLASFAESAGVNNLYEVPSAVDVARYKAARSKDTKFTVGWIGTPVTAQQSLPMICGPLKKFLSETESRCVLMGAGDTDLQGVEAKRLSWSESGEAEFFSEITVGLCPLEDSEWNRGKSGYKIIQYMAAGKPSLVSPVGIACDLVTDGQVGFQCRTEQEWYDRLMQLYEGHTLTQELGVRAQEEALEKYDTTVAAAKLHQIFQDCLKG